MTSSRAATGCSCSAAATSIRALRRDARTPTTECPPTPRDAYEIALVTAAIGRDLPLFAICRGIQVLNVALGGTPGAGHPDRRCPASITIPSVATAMIATHRGPLRQSRLAALRRGRLGPTALRRQQPPPPGGQASRPRPDGRRPPRRTASSKRRAPGVALLPRRPVAPRELLAHAPLPGPVRRFVRRVRATRRASPPAASLHGPARPASRRAPCSGRGRRPRVGQRVASVESAGGRGPASPRRRTRRRGGTARGASPPSTARDMPVRGGSTMIVEIARQRSPARHPRRRALRRGSRRRTAAALADRSRRSPGRPRRR